MYVILEGIDRAGKSTQMKMLQSRLPDAIFTKEPGGTKLGEAIRELVLHGGEIAPIAEMFLFLADRNQHLNEIILKNNQKTVISDRGFISGIAYAHVKTGLPIKKLIDLNMTSLEKTLPDRAVLLKLSPRELDRRLPVQKLDNIESKGSEFLIRVQEIMEHTLKICGIEHIVLDASQSKEALNEKIYNFITKDSKWPQ